MVKGAMMRSAETPFANRIAAVFDRLAAYRAARRAPMAQGFLFEPEGRPMGSFAAGQKLAAGSFHFLGRSLEAPDPFAVRPPSPAFAQVLHGWGWLDDLAAYGAREAREAARMWLASWIARFGEGEGPGWRPDLAGRRLFRWIEHALFLMASASSQEARAYLRALGIHAAFLARRARKAPRGLARIEALAGWAAAALSLRGLEAEAEPALAALAAEAEALIAEDGAIPSRNPEDLLQIAALLAWTRATADRRGYLLRSSVAIPPSLDAALGRLARALWALRHADGSLPRFHGGGAGQLGLAERVLALISGFQRRVRPVRPHAAMGYHRLDGGRTTVIVDAAPPPLSDRAQMGCLGFELVSGRRPVIGNLGPGATFGSEWAAEGRAASGISTLTLDGAGPARPEQVRLHRADGREGTRLIVQHDGWVDSHGLTHTRELWLSADGCALIGEDALVALTPKAEARFEGWLAAHDGRGPLAALRFHLHPGVEVHAEARGVRLRLLSGEDWLFRCDGPVKLALEPSAWLEPRWLSPQPTRQIVLRTPVPPEGLRIGWTLAKAAVTPRVIRDIGAWVPSDLEQAVFPAEFSAKE